jgi:diguanylate cyclase (GGDEF)-like protein
VLREASNGELHNALLDVSKHRSPWIADEHPIQLEGSQELIYADIRAVASRDGVVLSFRDVSQRRLDAARIAESEERFRLLAENAGDAVFLNTEGIMRWMSPAITPMLDWRPNELTGLLNRKEIFDRLTLIHGHRRQGDGQVAVLFCDIDHFKAINDNHGHRGGDAVLTALARRVLDCTRQDDLVGRIGGDELLVVLKGIPSLETAETIAAKIHAAARDPLALASGEVVPTLSIGVTLIRDGESIDAVVERADQAMYEAKQHRRDRVITFS